MGNETIGRYSVAIRTLGLNPELLRRELESIFAQTVKPDKVVIYIARGYRIPEFRVGYEMYVETNKGMVAQRAVDYKEIDSELILLADDDVTFAPDSAEKLITALHKYNLDCISPDTFQNHKMSLKQKVYAALTNLTFPHCSDKWAFRIHRNGSFSYINNPTREVYLSQSAGGPCALWRKESLLRTRFRDELWLDELGFAFNDDYTEFYKLVSNGGRLGVHFNAGVVNEDGKTSSGGYLKDANRFAIRAKAIYIGWHRTLYLQQRTLPGKLMTGAAFWLKALWMIPVHVAAAIQFGNPRIPLLYIRGLAAGVAHTLSDAYKRLKPYVRQ